MNMIITKNDYIINESIDLNKSFSIVYGLNGSGKTSLLKRVSDNENNHKICRQNKQHLIYLPIWRNEAGNSNIEPTAAIKNKDLVYEFDDIDIKKQIKIFSDINEYRDMISWALAYTIGVKKDQEIKDELQILFPGETISIDDFDRNSDGLKSILSILCVCLYSTVGIDCKSNTLREIFKSIHGFILIDEIDCYLHQKIQYKILKFLGDLMPNAKFLVTTHSPVILKTTRNSNNLYKISDRQINIHQGRFFENLDLILKEEFDIDFFDELPNDSIELLRKLSNENYLIDQMNKTDLIESIEKIELLNNDDMKFKLKQRQVDWMDYVLGRLKKCLELIETTKQ